MSLFPIPAMSPDPAPPADVPHVFGLWQTTARHLAHARAQTAEVVAGWIAANGPIGPAALVAKVVGEIPVRVGTDPAAAKITSEDAAVLRPQLLASVEAGVELAKGRAAEEARVREIAEREAAEKAEAEKRLAAIRAAASSGAVLVDMKVGSIWSVKGRDKGREIVGTLGWGHA